MKPKGLCALALVFVSMCITSASLAQPLPDEDDLPDAPLVDCEDPGDYQQPQSAPAPADPAASPACRAKGERIDGGPTPQPAPFEPEGEHPSPGQEGGGGGGSSSGEGGDPEETDTPTSNRPWTPTNGAMSGIQLSQGYSGHTGIFAALRVTDTRVPRNSSQYLSQRVLAKSCDNTDWFEIGWVEAGWRDDRQYIYTHDTPSSGWVFYDQYALTPGQLIYVQVVQSSSNSGLWQTYLWWNKGWQLLRETFNTDWLGCGGEVMVDRYQTGNGTYFNFNGPIVTGDGSTGGVQMRETGTGAWRNWDTSVPTATYPGEPNMCWTLYVTYSVKYTSWNTNSVNCAPNTTLSVTPTSGSRLTDFQAKLSGTTDWNGDPMHSLRIDWGDGTSDYPVSTSDVRVHRYANPGSYQVRGYACDDRGACQYSPPQSVHVDTSNSAPVVNFNVTPTSGDRTTVFNANFNGTYDPENDPISYRIEWGDGAVSNSQSASHRYRNAGTYTVTGRACDGFGACSTSSRSVTVEFSNQAPTAHLTVSPTTGDVRTTFTARLSGSDPDGDPITSYEISWGDGTTTSGSQATHQYQSPGQYTVEGIVTDSWGATGSASRDVTVCAVYEQGQCVESPPRQDPPVSPNLPPAATGPVAGVIRNGPELHDLAPSASEQLMVIDANVLQAYARDSDDYRDTCVKDAEPICDAGGRRKNFVERIKALYDKPASAQGDGMGQVVPDVVLLQEVRKWQSDNIAQKLTNTFGRQFTTAIAAANPEQPDTDAVTAECSDHVLDFQQCLEDIKIKADSAIIYNDDTLNLLGTSYIDSGYDPNERCDRIAGIDFDDDGDPDCLYAKWKRHYFAGFQKHLLNRDRRLTGYNAAVGSVHLVTVSHFDNDVNNESNPRHEDMKRRWSQEIADHLAMQYPSADYHSHVVGGDWNIHRCQNKVRTVQGDYPFADPRCTERAWFTTLTGFSFRDTILDLHRNDDSSGDRIVPQYRDGKTNTDVQHYRDKRIDFIFARSARLLRGSFDLTCGQGATGKVDRNCRDVRNDDLYSDHRLLWTLIQDDDG